MSTAKRLVVVGQGYVGLPLTVSAVAAGYEVTGIDVDERRIESLGRGASYIDDVSDDQLSRALTTGRYRPTTDYGLAKDFDIAVVTVPTPLKESLPDVSFIESATESLAQHLTPGATVILESTTYPGTTEELVVPSLERLSGLTAGTDFFVGYSPERIDPGNDTWNFANTPKIVSGIDAESLRRVNGFYAELVDRTVAVSSPREAELAKILENTFRHVNIALINEIAVFANELSINVWEAIDAASTKPFGFMKFVPGPGVGGHCLPVDPSYLSWQVRRKLGKPSRFIELANDINNHMPDYVVQRVVAGLNRSCKALNGSTVVMLGLAYKRNTADIRESPALRIIELLRLYGARITAVDPYIDPARVPDGVSLEPLSIDVIKSADAVVIVTAHDDFDFDLVAEHGKWVLDTQNAISAPGVEQL